MVKEWIWSIRISPFNQSVKKSFKRGSRGWQTLDFAVSFLSLRLVPVIEKKSGSAANIGLRKGPILV